MTHVTFFANLADSAEHRACHSSFAKEHNRMHTCAFEEKAVLSRDKPLCTRAFRN